MTGTFLQGLGSAVDKVREFFGFITSIFADVDFSVLWSWLPFPDDISAVLTGLLAVILLLAAFGFVKKIIVFFG